MLGSERSVSGLGMGLVRRGASCVGFASCFWMLLVRTLSPPSPVRPGGRGTLAAGVLQQWAYVVAGVRQRRPLRFNFFRGEDVERA